ncbi:MAG: FG-GAP-like repeat-containing protein [Bacteroidota bacterium]
MLRVVAFLLTPLLPLLGLAPSLAAQTFTNANDLVPDGDAFSSFGATIADVDGDGRADLVGQGGWLLQRDEGFEFQSFRTQFPLGALVGDVDDDGRADLFLMEAFDPNFYQYQPARERFVLFAGRDGISFRNTGIDLNRNFLTQGSVLFDYNQDGSLDLLLGNDLDFDLLYRGNGAGRFDFIQAGVPVLERGTYGMAAADYDRDGDSDIYIGLCLGITENLLYRNDGGAFEEVSVAVGVADERPSWGVAWIDFDNDGWQDLFVANMPSEGLSGKNRLYRNERDGTFTDVAEAASVDGPSTDSGWNVSVADFDNDGWQDLFVANSPGVSRLYRNNSDGTFTDVTGGANLSDITTTPAAAGDVNGDGWMDLYTPDSRFRLYLNDGGTNGWLRVRLRGVTSNREGVGARIEVTAGDLAMVREVQIGDGMMSQSEGRLAHFGLGTASSASVTVRWPSGQVDVYEGIDPNQTLTLVEGVGEDAPPAPFRLLTPAEESVVSNLDPVTFAWEPSTDEGVVYTLYLSSDDGRDQEFETTEPQWVQPDLAEGRYQWAVTADDGYSVRTSLGAGSFEVVSDVAADPQPQQAHMQVSVWPNPVQATMRVAFGLEAPGQVALDVYDLLGRRVAGTTLGWQAAGAHETSLSMERHPAGSYVVRLTREGQSPQFARFVLSD